MREGAEAHLAHAEPVARRLGELAEPVG
jgi:hypothetical protein